MGKGSGGGTCSYAGWMSTPDPRPRPDTAPGLRRRVERVSRPLLEGLVALPTWIPFVVMFALMLIGALVGGALGGVLIGIVVLALVWLFYLSWPATRSTERMLRLAVILIAVAILIFTVVSDLRA